MMAVLFSPFDSDQLPCQSAPAHVESESAHCLREDSEHNPPPAFAVDPNMEVAIAESIVRRDV